ncbi:ribose import permease protein RbsC [Paenibacillus marchantiophytorum]|uniref:Ribose import permease protein RbsC n=1 Tax=Paenibacillus marchantiophytorum TaxID=1619310 RepID=A0ABQ1EMJ9_9BACL|nr:ABC transporter permease [Paenibacillus marchantiophytorum]GFZ78769.1 ribose import permease protein RbsC [Paenibacillus marchantiophytorum]
MLQGSTRRQIKLSIPVYLVLTLLLIVTSILSPSFRTTGNFINIVSQVAPLAIVAIGQTIILLLGGIDLSVGSVISLSTIIMALYSDQGEFGLLGSLFFCVSIGALIGIINGVGIVKFKIPPLIMTLSTMTFVKGISLYLLPSPGGRINMAFMTFMTSEWGPVSIMGLLILFLYVLFFFILSSTKLGRYIYASGGDETHAKKSGIPFVKVQLTGYMLSGILAAVAGIVLSARIFSGDPIVGDAYSLDSVAATVVGGISLLGGIGSIVGTLAGVFIISMTNNVLNMLNIFAYYQYIVKGLILIMALLLFQLKRRRKS